MPPILIYICAAMLVLAIAPLPYIYYKLLRFVVFGVFAWASFICYEQKQINRLIGFAVFGILFNPVDRIHLEKEVWAIVNIVAALYLAANRNTIQDASQVKST